MFAGCLTITTGCAEDEDKIIDQSDNCCCNQCAPKVFVPVSQPPVEETDEKDIPDETEEKDEPDTNDKQSSVTIIIENDNDNTNDNENRVVVNQCTKSYNILKNTNGFEMTKSCKNKKPCYGKGHWEKYNGHYVMNYTELSCDDKWVEQVPCGDID